MGQREPLLLVRELQAAYASSTGDAVALDRVSFDLARGEVLGVAGESGSGKSTLGLSIARLLRPPGRMVGGQVVFGGEDLLNADAARLRRIRLKHLAMVFQDATSALNPLLSIGTQLIEGQLAHLEIDSKAAATRSVELLRAVGIPDPGARMRQFPHEMSGGMRQRLCIAIALSCDPELLIADEPTTALDVTVQAQILDLLRTECVSRKLAMLVISHDLGVIARLADRVAVLYAGQIVEEGPVRSVLDTPRHHYTRLLLKARPRISDARRSRFDAIAGSPPHHVTGQAGCAFANRCPAADDTCRTEKPPRVRAGADHQALCWHPAE